MSFQIAKSFEFSASHQLDLLPDDHKCKRLHGHNYKVELILEAEDLDSNGFVLDYGEFSKFKEFIDTHFDHKHLNEVFHRLGISGQSSAECLARFLCATAFGMFGERVRAVRVSETPNTWAQYNRN